MRNDLDGMQLNADRN